MIDSFYFSFPFIMLIKDQNLVINPYVDFWENIFLLKQNWV